MHEKNEKSYKQKVDWQRLEDNLFYKYVLHNIMSGEIDLCDQVVGSDKIASELGLFVKIFLIRKSSLVNKKLEYQGELVDDYKPNPNSQINTKIINY